MHTEIILKGIPTKSFVFLFKEKELLLHIYTIFWLDGKNCIVKHRFQVLIITVIYIYSLIEEIYKVSGGNIQKQRIVKEIQKASLILQTIKLISSFSQIAQWLEHVHGKHKVVGSNHTQANFLYGINKPQLKMNTIYICKFGYTPMIN